MKKVVKFLIKAITCIWVGAFIPLIFFFVSSINQGDISRAGAIIAMLAWGAVLCVLGANWGDKE